jgi:hypothetical protein
MNKKTFVAMLTAIKAESERKHQIANLLCKDSYAIITIGQDLELLVEQYLTELFGCDDQYGGLISWWLWEDVEKVIYDGEKKIPVETAEALFDYLKKNFSVKKSGKKRPDKLVDILDKEQLAGK